MKSYLVTIFFIFIFGNLKPGQTKTAKTAEFIDPTGSYKLQLKTKKRDGDVYGYFGDIHVKLLDHSKIAMSFYICSGAPAYNSGAFVDTLHYKENTAVYRDSDSNKGCTVTFKFNRKSVNI